MDENLHILAQSYGEAAAMIKSKGSSSDLDSDSSDDSDSGSSDCDDLSEDEYTNEDIK